VAPVAGVKDSTMESPKEFLAAVEAEDDIGLVIRAHILIEEQLNKMFDTFFLRPEYLEKMNLDYHQKVHLAISSGLSPLLEKPLKSIGSIRNKFAHQSDQILDSGIVNNLYKSFDNESKNNFHKTWKLVSDNNDPEEVTSFNQLDPKERFRLMAIIIHKYLRICLNDLKRRSGL
uniref:hypothetical protein n=1 Tax=Microbulbifer mangrovi TaxID=927787 RepID=UPI0009905BC8